MTKWFYTIENKATGETLTVTTSAIKAVNFAANAAAGGSCGHNIKQRSRMTLCQNGIVSIAGQNGQYTVHRFISDL